MVATVHRPSGRVAEGEREPGLPSCPHERQEIYDDGVLEMVLTLRRLMKSPDDTVALKAVIEFRMMETARQRHGATVAGCRRKPAKPAAVSDEDEGPVRRPSPL